jgi:hypothetical protein
VSSLAQQIHIRTAYTRSINLPRDQENLELVKAYVPTWFFEDCCGVEHGDVTFRCIKFSLVNFF